MHYNAADLKLYEIHIMYQYGKTVLSSSV